MELFNYGNNNLVTVMSWVTLIIGRGADLPKWHFFKLYSKFLWYGQIQDISSKTLYSFRENLPSNRPNYFFDFPIIGPKIKIVVNLCIWVSKSIRRKIQTQWKKNELNPAYHWGEKSQKTSENIIFQESVIFGWFLRFFSSQRTLLSFLWACPRIQGLAPNESYTES